LSAKRIKTETASASSSTATQETELSETESDQLWQESLNELAAILGQPQTAEAEEAKQQTAACNLIVKSRVCSMVDDKRLVPLSTLADKFRFSCLSTNLRLRIFVSTRRTTIVVHSNGRMMALGTRIAKDAIDSCYLVLKTLQQYALKEQWMFVEEPTVVCCDQRFDLGYSINLDTFHQAHPQFVSLNKQLYPKADVRIGQTTSMVSAKGIVMVYHPNAKIRRDVFEQIQTMAEKHKVLFLKPKAVSSLAPLR
jgi:hypothetical protein